MLVLSRKAGEEVVIGREIRVKVVEVRGGRAQIGIHAPRRVEIRRAEVTPTDGSQSCEDETGDFVTQGRRR